MMGRMNGGTGMMWLWMVLGIVLLVVLIIWIVKQIKK
jgi:hypothetical protein